MKTQRAIWGPHVLYPNLFINNVSTRVRVRVRVMVKVRFRYAYGTNLWVRKD